MLMVDLLQWWYFRGWNVFVSDFKQKIGDLTDFFSFSQLFRTLFKPFRQISASSTTSAGESRISVFFDCLISRIVGFFARIFIIIFGTIVMIFVSIVGIILIIIWPLLPLLAVGGIVLTIMGVTL